MKTYVERLVFLHPSSRRGARGSFHSELVLVQPKRDSIPRSRLHERVDIRRQVCVFKLWRVPLRRNSILADEELFKVPRHIRPSHRRPLNRHGVRLRLINVIRSQSALVVRRFANRILQKRPKRVLFVPVDRHLPRDREFRFVSISRSHVLQRVQQFKVFIVALVSELVARHAEDDQVVPVLFLQGVQLNKVPDGRASERRDVVDEDDFALVSAQREVLAVRGRVARATAERLEREVVDGGRGADAHGGARGRAGGARTRGRARERGVREGVSRGEHRKRARESRTLR